MTAGLRSYAVLFLAGVIRVIKKPLVKLGVVVHTHNPMTQESEAKG